MEVGATSSRTNRVGRFIVISLIREERVLHSLILARRSSGSDGGLRCSRRSRVMMSPNNLRLLSKGSIASELD
jgi:hypothetical protein